jgi:carbon-monoxide dehydrogenase small subunit
VAYNLELTVNGQLYRLEVAPSKRLLDVLREDLNLTGTKEGCGEGECGACSVILDGKLVNSCLVLALQANGKTVLTVEGLAENDELHPLQKAFLTEGAVQCGYCTPGMLLAAKALLDENPNPSREEIKTALSGNLCRCTGYEHVIRAVERVVRGDV